MPFPNALSPSFLQRLAGGKLVRAGAGLMAGVLSGQLTPTC